MKNYITSTKNSQPPVHMFFNEIGDDIQNNELNGEIDLRMRGFVEIAYSNFLGGNNEEYSIYFYSNKGDMIFAKRVPILKNEDKKQNGLFISFVQYNDRNFSVYAYAIVKGLDELIQFVSMDNVITGIEGPANGIESEIFGAHFIPFRNLQQGDSPINQASFSLVGSGCDSDSFTPIETRPTPGQMNPGQTFSDCRSYSPQPSEPLGENSNTFATPLGNGSRGLGTESFVGIIVGTLVIIMALFVGGKRYSTRSDESEELKYFEGGDVEAQMLGATTPDVLESIPGKPVPILSIAESSAKSAKTTTSRKSNTRDDSSASTSHSNARISSLISSKDLQSITPTPNQTSELSTALITFNIGDESPLDVAVASESVLERGGDVKDDISASTSYSTVIARSLLSSKNLMLQPIAPITPIESSVDVPLASVISDVGNEENEIKPLYGLNDWKFFGTSQPSQQENDTISESSIFTKSRSLMSKLF